MNILYNGNNHTLETACTIHELLEKKGKAAMPIVAKLNGKYIPRKDMKTVLLNEGDNLHLILFMGGG